VAVIGTDEAFLLTDGEGTIRAVKSVVRLSVGNGGLVKLPFGKDDENVIVSAQGYEMWAEKAGAQVVYPDEVFYAGKYEQNPFQMRDKDGEFAGWVIRAVAFRLSPFGLPQVQDRTLICDIENLRSIEFLAKAKYCKQAFKVLPKGSKVEEAGTWIEYPNDKWSSLFVNSSHQEGLDWYRDIQQMVKNSLQKALTQVARNALKHLSAIQKSPGGLRCWDIPTICYRAQSGSIVKWDPSTFVNLRRAVGTLVSGDRSEFTQIELRTGIDFASAEDEVATAEVTEEDKVEAIEVPTSQSSEEAPKKERKRVTREPAQKPTENVVPEPAEKKAETTAPPADPPPPAQKVHPDIANLLVLEKEFPDIYAKALKELGVSQNQEIRADLAATICKKMNSLVDQANQ
jgi:hypothetical protein